MKAEFISILNELIHRKGRKERKAQPQYGTRMTRIQRIFTDPCQPAPSVKSVFYRDSRMKSTGRKVSAFIRVHPRFFKNVIFQTGLTGFTGYGFNPVYSVILSNSKYQLPAPQQSAMTREVTLL